MEMPNCEKFLRIWIGVVAFMALGNTFQCFFGNPKFLAEKLYNGKPELMNQLTARLFGMWTLLACICRAFCSLYIRNKVLYTITLLSFVLALLHFTLELLEFGTCALDVGVISPLIVSSVSLIWMFIGQWFIEFDEIMPKVRSSRSERKIKPKLT